MEDGHCYYKGRYQKKTGTGIFPKSGTPQVWEPRVCEEKNYDLFCILGPQEHFWFSQKCSLLGWYYGL